MDLVDLVVSGFLVISWGFWGFGGFWVPGHFSGFLATFLGFWPDPGFLGGVARSGHFRLGGGPSSGFFGPPGAGFPDSARIDGSGGPGVRGSWGPGGARSGRKGTDPVGVASVVSGRPWSDSGSNPKLK